MIILKIPNLKTIKQIESAIDDLKKLESDIKDQFSQLYRIESDFNNIKTYLPSFKKRI